MARTPAQPAAARRSGEQRDRPHPWPRDSAPDAAAGRERPGRAAALGLISTFLLALSSAVLPAGGMELGLVGIAATSTAPAWALALVAAVGQVLGKTLYYLLGAGVISRIPLVRHRPGRTPRAPSARRTRWALRLAAAQAWAVARPWGPAAVVLVSAVVGLPPFAVTSLLAGTLRVPLWVFWTTGVVGRSVRFLVVITAGGGVTDWLVG